ncbi:hypothetical protein [Pararhizobium haloflavum]|uniref:hypothetical protein n=1 Tax=Pararhizobium haloflavum TaxID=2037914 RepID=UPI000C1A0271|nr:hypothetical protein [Pararhizobium haloflavum]
MTPSTLSYRCGETRHGQQVELTWRDGAWRIVKHAANQRDETQTLDGLSDSAILMMAEAVRDRQQRSRS